MTLGDASSHYVEIRITGPHPMPSHWHATPGGAMQCARHLRNALGEAWTVTTHPRAEPTRGDKRRVAVRPRGSRG
jgi:hypothetical protein